MCTEIWLFIIHSLLDLFFQVRKWLNISDGWCFALNNVNFLFENMHLKTFLSFFQLTCKFHSIIQFFHTFLMSAMLVLAVKYNRIIKSSCSIVAVLIMLLSVNIVKSAKLKVKYFNQSGRSLVARDLSSDAEVHRDYLMS